MGKLKTGKILRQSWMGVPIEKKKGKTGLLSLTKKKKKKKRERERENHKLVLQTLY